MMPLSSIGRGNNIVLAVIQSLTNITLREQILFIHRDLVLVRLYKIHKKDRQSITIYP